MNIPRILVLSTAHPGAPTSGGVFLRDLLKVYPRDYASYFTLFSQQNYKREEVRSVPELVGMPSGYACIPRLQGVRRAGCFVYELSTTGLYFWHWYRNARKVAHKVIEFGDSINFDTLLVTLSHPFLIMVVSQILSLKKEIKLVSMIWDPPEVALYKLNDIANRLLKRQLIKILNKTSRCGVASDRMGVVYQKHYQIEPVVLIHGVAPDKLCERYEQLHYSDKLIIGFAGTLYAKEEWLQLLKTLNKVQWKIANKKVSIRFIGAPPLLPAGFPVYIEYLGWRPVEETVQLLAETDILYLPYWFDQSYRISVTLSFPNKFPTYLAAGRPVFYHGPEDAAVPKIFQTHPAGMACHSMEIPEILQALETFVADQSFYARAVRMTEQLVEDELNIQVFHKRFAQLLNIDPGVLYTE